VGDLVFIDVGRRRGFRRGVAATTWYELGVSVEATDPAGARVAYERALAGCPDLADAHCNLGRLHHDTGDLARAESHYRLAICAAPTVALYWFNLGVVVEDQGRIAEAVAAYEEAIAIGGVADAHFNLARLLEQTGRRLGDDELIRGAVRQLLGYRKACASTWVRRAR
jgi:tetratricopeptide (TPR) repeat protein